MKQYSLPGILAANIAIASTSRPFANDRCLIFRSVEEETQLNCPLSILPTDVITACKAWQTDAASQYDCSPDEYLRSLSPGKYEGVVAKYLSFNTAQATGHFPERAEMFTKCTGGVIDFTEAADIAEDPITDIGSASAQGVELYDAYLMIYSFTSEASSLGLLETLNDRIREKSTLLQYQDILPKVRSMSEYRKDGKTNIDLLMADGDFFVPIVRIDLLERDGKPLPHTWEDVIELAKFYNGTDLNEDGDTDDFGFCIYPRTGSGFNDAWIPELMYSTWATTDQTKSIQQGFFFDEKTFEPRIGNGFANAMDIWKELWANSADGCTSPNFIEGRCAIGFAPPGCWKGVFIDSSEGGVKRTDANGTVIWRPRMKDGSYAEPYMMKSFGSLRVVDRETDELVDCELDICPKGEKISPSKDLTNGDRAKLLVDSPHVNKIINRVPFYWSVIRKSSKPEVKDLMFDFFAYVNSPITSVYDVVLPSWLDPWRASQLNNCSIDPNNNEWQDDSQTCNFKDGGYSEITFKEFKSTMAWALGNDVNSALTLRLPGILTYTRDVLLENFLSYMAGTISMEKLQSDVKGGWEESTKRRGKLNQLQIYRASLGLNPLPEYELCQLHREEMDQNNPEDCAKYDPKEDDSNKTLVIATVVPLVFFFTISAILFVWWRIERNKRKADVIWKIASSDLKFDNPPQIAGRGTFGLVVKAEYRGTTVAVKRVIPPKEKALKSSSLLGFGDNYTTLEMDSDSLVSSGALTSSIKNGNMKRQAIQNNAVPRRGSLDLIFEDKETDDDVGGYDSAIPKNLWTTNRRISQESSIASENEEPTNKVLVQSHSSAQTASLSDVETGYHSGQIVHIIQTLTAETSVAISLSKEMTPRTKSMNKWKSYFGVKNSDYQQLKQDLIVEMRIISKLRHPCITTLMGCVIDSKEEPMLVMEYMEYGSLYDLLHNASFALDGELIFPILSDIARGARFLHAADPKIIHGDLKAANVLVDSRFRAKISDFGLSAKKKHLGATGTPYWMAPELLRKETTNTAESDVYSFGVILYELYSRRDPYEGEDPVAVLDQICNKNVKKRPPVPVSCPHRLAEIMQECMDDDPAKRPTFEEIDVRIQRLDSENVEPGESSFSHQLIKNKMRSSRQDNLINSVFPKHVAEALMQGRQAEADRVEMATMFFSDIVGFTTISSQLTPDQVSNMLDQLYLKFDALSEKHDVFKIETIGDAYVGVCNLVKKQEEDHAKRIAEFAIETIKAASETPILADKPSMGTIQIRVGIHCGPLVARVVGSRNPRYCVFGDTVNTTARMESNSLSMHVHCSDRAAELLKVQAPKMVLKCRGVIPIKGKGDMETYFIEHAEYFEDAENPAVVAYFGEC